MLRLLRILSRGCRPRWRSLFRQQRAGSGIGQDVFALKGGVGVEQRRRIGLLLLQLAQIDIARQLRQRIDRVQLASGVSSSGWLPGLATGGGVTAAGAFGVNSSTRLSQISLGMGAADFSLAAAAGPQQRQRRRPWPPVEPVARRAAAAR